ncbi:MAG: hypothetical protein ACE5JX_09900 [Acidobacteriota bacterium]
MSRVSERRKLEGVDFVVDEDGEKKAILIDLKSPVGGVLRHGTRDEAWAPSATVSWSAILPSGRDRRVTRHRAIPAARADNTQTVSSAGDASVGSPCYPGLSLLRTRSAVWVRTENAPTNSS